ncbi:MAG: siroheme synthase CysG [Otoolea sp.]
MSFFPFFKEIKGAAGLIVGGGKVALRKVEKLLPYGPKLTVVAPELLPEFFGLDVVRMERPFRDSDLSPEPEFVIAACDDARENRRISLLCRENKIPVNVVDCPEDCTFFFPSLVKRGKLSVGISTSGASPSAAVWLREEIEKLLPGEMEELLDRLAKQRVAVKEEIKNEAERGRRLKELFFLELENCGREDHTAEAVNLPEKPAAGTVSLVGAGCGTKEWITLEGLSLLRSCDAVVYDDLIDPALLEEVPKSAEQIYVGKRSHKPSADQEEIKELLVRLAREKKRVVRLKGGDPFVFGRGGEEIQYLNQHQILWRTVPGISSALAIPEEAGIPVTHRGVSRSIHIMTAHTREDALRKDLEQFANLEGTLVILMGLESLETIVAVLMEQGRDKNTPAAVLSGGNSDNRCKVTGTLETIVERARKKNVTTPAIIVIGNVVALDLQNPQALPLSGVRVGLTGTDDFQAKLRDRLLSLGAEPVSLMRGSCEELEASIPWERITDSESKWLVFTSVQGIRSFFGRCRQAGIDHRRFMGCKFAVIGAATARELESYGFSADLCPSVYTSKALAEKLFSRRAEGEPIYLFCSRQGTDLLAEKAQAAGGSCYRLDLYDTFFSCGKKKEEAVDYVLFGSAGGVRALKQSGYLMKREESGAEGICIGPVCSKAYRECYGEEPRMAVEATVESLIQALLEAAEDGRNSEEWKRQTVKVKR